MFQYPFLSCFEPRYLKDKQMYVRCGHCPACIAIKNTRQASLCDYESLSNIATLHVTLTFDDLYVPFGYVQTIGTTRIFKDCHTDEELGRCEMTDELFSEYDRKVNSRINYNGIYPYLDKTYLQNFMKRLRKRLFKYEEDKKVRFFGAGEYGPERFRPHFHILFFVNDKTLLEESTHVLGEFPENLWSKEDKKNCRKDTVLSRLEYHIRKSWQLGSVSIQQISGGSASSYVAGYVNGSVPLPALLKVKSCKPFSQHSRFLGREIFGKELTLLQRQRFIDLVEKSLFVRGKYGSFQTPREMYDSLYPKCKGFALRTDAQLLRLYSIYQRFSAYFKIDKPIQLARKLVNLYLDFYERGYVYVSEHVHDILFDVFSEIDIYIRNIPFYYREFFYTPNAAWVYNPDSDPLWKSEVFSVDKIGDKQYDRAIPYLRKDEQRLEKIVLLVYDMLRVSKVFTHNANNWWFYLIGKSPVWYSIDRYKLYLNKVKRFWSFMDMRRLNDFYKKQEHYFTQPYSKPRHYVLFYDNMDIDYENVTNRLKKNTFAYKAFVANTTTMAKKRMKHKEQNDLNQIFEENG